MTGLTPLLGPLGGSVLMRRARCLIVGHSVESPVLMRVVAFRHQVVHRAVHGGWGQAGSAGARQVFAAIFGASEVISGGCLILGQSKGNPALARVAAFHPQVVHMAVHGLWGQSAAGLENPERSGVDKWRFGRTPSGLSTISGRRALFSGGCCILGHSNGNPMVMRVVTVRHQVVHMAVHGDCGEDGAPLGGHLAPLRRAYFRQARRTCLTSPPKPFRALTRWPAPRPECAG